MRYLIVYTNGRTVQGHHVYCLISKVNIFSQVNVQRVIPTSPMQVSIIEFYHLVFRVVGHECHSCGELLEIVK